MSELYRPRESQGAGARGGVRLGVAVRATILGLSADDTAARVSAALTRVGIPVILLKGAAIAMWLYADGEARGYGDADLLVPPDRVPEARRVLARLGYRPRLGVDLPATATHAATFDPPSAGATVDLHWTIPGARVAPEELWMELATRHTTALVVGGERLVVLDEPGRALHLMLHAFQHGPADAKPLRDLAKAIERLPDATWASAGALARRLRGWEPALSGLRMTPGGRDLARRLHWEARDHLMLMGRLNALPGGPGHARTLHRWWQTPTLAGRVAWARAALLPSPAYMRLRYALARRGAPWLALAYAWRCAVATGRLPGALATIALASIRRMPGTSRGW